MNTEKSHLLLAFCLGLSVAGVIALLTTMWGDERCTEAGGVTVRGAWMKPVCVKPLTT
jgi:hypothetical protein